MTVVILPMHTPHADESGACEFAGALSAYGAGEEIEGGQNCCVCLALDQIDIGKLAICRSTEASERSAHARIGLGLIPKRNERGCTSAEMVATIAVDSETTFICRLCTGRRRLIAQSANAPASATTKIARTLRQRCRR
jgi:hypothetical protein